MSYYRTFFKGNKDEYKIYYKDKECKIVHRENGPAVEWADGSKAWYINGFCHRQAGPAIEWINGSKEWFINGQLHREDGPAREFMYDCKEYFLNGKKYKEEEYWGIIRFGGFV